LQSLVGLPACAAGRPLMNTFDAPPTTTPPQPFLPPAIAAGRPLMKTSREPSTTGAARRAVADARRRLAADRRIRTALRDDARGLGNNHSNPTAQDRRDRE